MRISRLAAGLVTAGLVGFAPIAVTAPADAATVTTVATLTSYDTDGVFEYGDDLSLTGSIKSSTGGSVFSGTYALQVSTAATPAFTTIATGTASGFLSFDVPASANATYQLVYSGGSSSSDTFTATTSAPYAAKVTRKLSLKTKRLQVIGKVSPDYSKKKIKIFRKDGKKFKKFASVKTDKKGRFTFNAPRRNKFKFIVVVPGDSTFTANPPVLYTVTVY